MPLTEHIDGPLVAIRRLQLSDKDELFGAIRQSMPELSRWMPWATPEYSPDDAADFLARVWTGWKQGDCYEFAVVDRHDGALLGLCGLNCRQDQTMNMGFWVRTPVAGRGITTAAARMVARFGFQQLLLDRVSMYHVVGNVGSRGVALSAGFRLEGLQRSRARLNGQAVDCLSYAMVSAAEIKS